MLTSVNANGFPRLCAIELIIGICYTTVIYIFVFCFPILQCSIFLLFGCVKFLLSFINSMEIGGTVRGASLP